jgi:4-aminobutyrate aminotransferase-like enzyme
MKPRTTARIKGIIERDRKVMFTTTRVPYPFVPYRAGADYAYDVSGNKFIDFSSFVSVYDIGDNAIAAMRVAAKKQIDRLIHAAFTDYYAELPVIFAEKLVNKFPKGFGRVFFSNSGTEANEAALKFSRLFTKRQYAMSFYNSAPCRLPHQGTCTGSISGHFPTPYTRLMHTATAARSVRSTRAVAWHA